jgi:hypothetical protein
LIAAVTAGGTTILRIFEAGDSSKSNYYTFASFAKRTTPTNTDAIFNTLTYIGGSGTTTFTKPCISLEIAGASGSSGTSGESVIFNEIVVDTASATAAKTATKVGYTLTSGDFIAIQFTLGTSVATPTLSINGGTAYNIRLGSTNASTTTLTVGALGYAHVYFTGTHFQLLGSYRTSDETEDATMRWTNTIQVGGETTRTKLLMEGINGKFYPISTGNFTTANTKTISSVEFKISGSVLYYSTTTTLAADATTTSVYSEITIGTNFAYTANQIASWNNFMAVYLKGTVNSSGNFILAGAGTTGNDFMTQTLPTTQDGFVYMLLGFMYSTTTSFRLIAQHPLYEFRNGVLRPYIAQGADGTSGTSGSTGSSGSSGSSGTSGTSGSSGTSGTSGSSGSSGSSGQSGAAGSSGSSGSSGQSGAAGSSGSSGSSGQSGAVGSSGTSGQSGAAGTSGSSGTSGTRGSSGTSGQSGAAGSSGSSGSSGTSGTRGSSGTSGSSGSSGTRGSSGSSGSSGQTGGAGSSGSSGSSGQTGGAGSSGTSGVSPTLTDTLATVTARGASTTEGITISRNAFAYGGTTQSFLIDGAAGNGALTINSASAYAYLNFAQAGTTKMEMGIVGTAGARYGSLYINRNIQVGETGASIIVRKSNGYVGINQLDPSYQLHVSTSDNEGIYLQGTGGGVWMNMKSASGKLWSYGAQNDGCGIYNRTDAAYVFFIKDSGLTGIGTTDPGHRLDVSGDIRGQRYRGINSLVLNTYTTVNPASNVFLYSQPNDRDAWIFLDSADTGSNWGIYHRQIDTAVSNLPGNSLGFIGGGANGLQAYVSLANGNGYFAGSLGIGYTSASFKLDVNGSTRITNQFYPNWGINLNRANGARTGISHYNDTYFNWQEYMSPAGTTNCGPNGNLTAPSGLSAVTSWAWRYRMEGVSTYGFLWETGSGGGGDATASPIMELNATSGTLRVSGDLIAYASDRRLKTNIKVINDALSKVGSIRGVEYDWVDGIEEKYGFHPTSKHEVGVIAQEIQEVLPEAVLTAPFNGAYKQKSGEDPNFLTVKYERVVPLLIEAIKELNQKVEDQQKIINDLLNR